MEVIVPAAMTIEMAIAQLADQTYVDANKVWLDDQTRELESALPGKPEAFHAGYQLGVQTARVLISGMPAAVFNKVSI